MSILKSFLNWIYLSSKDPQNVSLTLRAGVPFVVFLAGFTQYHSQIEALVRSDDLIAATTGALVLSGQAVTGILAAFGLARKIWNTAK